MEASIMIDKLIELAMINSNFTNQSIEIQTAFKAGYLYSTLTTLIFRHPEVAKHIEDLIAWQESKIAQ